MQTDSVLSEKFLLAFDEAIQKATNLEKNILFSYTQSVEWCHPLPLFDSKPKELEPCFFWEKPSERRGLVGIGAAFIIEAQGPERFNTVAHRWQELLNDAVILFSSHLGLRESHGYPMSLASMIQEVLVA